MNAPNTSKRDRILDIAEALFALHGFDGVTMREIANGAEVDVALASYHFGKKRDVFDAVFMRRADMLNSSRREVLYASQEKDGGKNQSIEQIIEAFLLPLKMAQQTGDPGWKNYLALLAYIMASPLWSQEMMPRMYDKLVEEFIEALRTALPGATDENIYWCYHYLSGALTLTLAQTGRIDKLSKGKCLSSDFDAAYEHMIPFVAAGFRAVCGNSSQK
jgi:AcrR family transcriptional regulator